MSQQGAAPAGPRAHPRLPQQAAAGGSVSRRRVGVPEATVARLPEYLRALHALAEQGRRTVSSQTLAGLVGGSSARIRKDLSHLGSYGTRGVGYEVEDLVLHISRVLGLTQSWSVVLVGVGNLGRALAGYGGFSSRGFRVAALLDSDPALIGQVVAGRRVRDVAELGAVLAETGSEIGVIATPAEAAQEVCELLVGAGLTSILTFAPVPLRVPEGVDVRTVDLALELQILSFHQTRRVGSAAGLTA